MESNKLAESANIMLKSIMDTSGQAKGFVLEQMPLVCQEYVQYEFIISLIPVVIGLVIILASSLLIKKCWSLSNCKDGPIVIFPILGIVIGCCFIGSNLETLIKSKTAPRVLILEKASELYKGR